MKQFEWDPNKNRKNKNKHGVTFEEASEIFEDEDGIEKLGKYRGEVRILRIGKTTTKLILLVVYTMRDVIIRIISARQTTRKERNAYIGNKLSKESDEDGSKNE